MRASAHDSNPSSRRIFAERHAAISPCALRSRPSASPRGSAPFFRTFTHPYFAAYGAGITPSRSMSRSKSSSSHLKASWCSLSTSKPANILSPMEKMRLSPHLMSSLAPGRSRQKSARLPAPGRAAPRIDARFVPVAFFFTGLPAARFFAVFVFAPTPVRFFFIPAL